MKAEGEQWRPDNVKFTPMGLSAMQSSQMFEQAEKDKFAWI
jgi:hypothetical protein